MLLKVVLFVTDIRLLHKTQNKSKMKNTLLTEVSVTTLSAFANIITSFSVICNKVTQREAYFCHRVLVLEPYYNCIINSQSRMLSHIDMEAVSSLEVHKCSFSSHALLIFRVK